VALDTPAKLKAGLGGDIIRIKTKDSIDKVRQFDFVHKVEQSDGFLVLSVDNAKRALPALLQAVEAESAEFASPTLNDVFIQITGRNIKEQAEGGFMERYAKYD
jgi:ABC-2 type transport system ATP-binding protein